MPRPVGARPLTVPPRRVCAQPACPRPAQPSGYCVRCEGLVARGLASDVRPELHLGPVVAPYNRYALVQGDAA
jgi:hypothetical protein